MNKMIGSRFNKVSRKRKPNRKSRLKTTRRGEADNKAANNLVHELKGQQGSLEEFLTHYEAQVQWRVERRDRLGTYLSRWLESDAIKIVAAAYKGAPKAS